MEQCAASRASVRCVLPANPGSCAARPSTANRAVGLGFEPSFAAWPTPSNAGSRRL